MTTSSRFSYVRAESGKSEATILAYLPLQLSNRESTVSVSALVDSGSTVNVLPYSIGLQLDFVWEQQTIPVVLTGSLSRLPARGVIVMGQIDTLPSVELAFAWTQEDSIPTILGQINFFSEFDICFFRSQGEFEVTLRT